MDVVNVTEGRCEQQESLLQEDNAVTPYSTDSDGYDSTDQQSNEFDKTSDEGQDLKSDLQRTIPECYKSDLSYSSTSCSDITNQDELQASALCQFMDILNDLDEVLDKSLLACLDDGAKFDSDEDDVICKTRNDEDSDTCTEGGLSTSVNDDTEVVINVTAHVSPEDTELNRERPLFVLGRSKSLSEISPNIVVTNVEQSGPVEDVRSSMRRLDPIMLPAIPPQPSCEALTLPVILFLEHNINMRPTSAPIQLQVTAANLNSEAGSAPLIVGRRALLMNRALSLPSPGGSDATLGDWTGRNTAQSLARSASASSTSTESLNVVLSQQHMPTAPDDSDEGEDPPFGVWPHRLSSMLACLSCTVGIFNISRFAMFSVHFGASFIVQFFILSLLIGIPLFTLHLCLGQVLKSGPIDMWRISPIFQGVGISLLVTQAVIGIYSILGLSWIFVYFRDSFISAHDRYKWTLPLDFNSDDGNITNATFKIQETVPQYFHGEVLQRNIGGNISSFGTIKFQVAFNLAVVWMIVFVGLSKGLRSYGKTVYILIILPICGILILCTKILTMVPYDSVMNIFSETEWSEFFMNSHSWAAAAQETFLTWGVLGACVMQLTSHKSRKNKSRSMLQRESACIVCLTFAILLLAALFANTCMQILNKDYHYLPGSFETVKSSQFLWPRSEPLPGSAASTPLRYMGHYASIVGVTVWRSGGLAHQFSGWQPLQLATLIVPATLDKFPTEELSPVWAVIFYFILILFGIAQQLAIWHCVVTGLLAINPAALRCWETSITFLSCVAGLLIGLLFTTDAGIKLVHFMDYVWAGSWWQCLVHVSLVCGVFVVRGRPYSGDVVVAALFSARGKMAATLAALLSFTWNVILPVVLCAVCVVDFRTGIQRQLYTWRRPIGYWPIISRQLAVAMQQFPLVMIPAAAFIQTWRYMSKGPPDILERVQNLYRPRTGAPHESVPPAPPPPPARAPSPDPPPKYTPPPSYSTATGARLLRTIRTSFRTLRRVATSRTESLANVPSDISQMPITLSEAIDNETSISLHSQPPEYSGEFATPTFTISDETDSPIRPISSTSRTSLSLTRDILRRSFITKSDSAKSIRSSLRRSFRYGANLTTSHEHLVGDAEPISNTVAMSAMLNTRDSPLHTRASII